MKRIPWNEQRTWEQEYFTIFWSPIDPQVYVEWLVWVKSKNEGTKDSFLWFFGTIIWSPIDPEVLLVILVKFDKLIARWTQSDCAELIRFIWIIKNISKNNTLLFPEVIVYTSVILEHSPKNINIRTWMIMWHKFISSKYVIKTWTDIIT